MALPSRRVERSNDPGRQPATGSDGNWRKLRPAWELRPRSPGRCPVARTVASQWRSRHKMRATLLQAPMAPIPSPRTNRGPIQHGSPVRGVAAAGRNYEGPILFELQGAGRHRPRYHDQPPRQRATPAAPAPFQRSSATLSAARARQPSHRCGAVHRVAGPARRWAWLRLLPSGCVTRAVTRRWAGLCSIASGLATPQRAGKICSD